MKKVIAIALTLVMLMSLSATLNVGAASMTDDMFFAKFNYVAFPGLNGVKAKVDAGDYIGAKKELLHYFKERHDEGKIHGFGVDSGSANYGLAVMGMRNILAGANTQDIWRSEFFVKSSSFTNYEADVTGYVASQTASGYVSFMLFAGDKGGDPVYIKSREAGEDVSPKLEVVFEKDGTEETILVEADKDTYIASGVTNSNYGKVTELVINEDGTGSSSVGTNSRRTYINFPIGETANSTVVSAKLIVNAAYDTACTTGDKSVLVISIGDTTWGEGSLNWSSVKANMFSYENADVPTWGANAPNADAEYHNVTARFWFGKPMAYEYIEYLKDPVLYNETHPYSDTYPGEDFGPHLVKMMDAFASQRNYGWNRTLETGERLSRWVDIMDALLGTDVFDTHLDEFCNIISYMWGDCNYLSGLDITNGSYWWSNWRIISNAGFFKAVEFFPEFNTYSAWRERVEGNVEYTLDLLYNDDYSFTEAGPGYSVGCINHFTECIRAAEMSGNPMNRVFVEKLKLITRNALESFYPNGYGTNIGDSDFTDSMGSFRLFNDVFKGEDKVIKSYVEGEELGAEYLTRFYHTVNSAYMRNSWDPEEAVYINFTNNPSDGHYHPDSNQVLFYAYGEPLLVDSGRYSYSTANNIYNLLRTAEAHNTIEAEGLSMGAHTVAAKANSMDYAVTNDSFDFAATKQYGYTNVTHTRNVFFSRKGFGIVTDFVEGNTDRAYRQNWHFLPLSGATIEDNTVRTNFEGKANVAVSAASSENTQIKDGYHSITYGVVTPSKYASFEKKGKVVKFDTLLYPERAGEEATAYLTDLAEEDFTKVAVKMTVDGEESCYYLKNTDEADGEFGEFITDAKMAYVSDNEYMLMEGKMLSGKIESPNSIVAIGVEIANSEVIINGEKLTASTDKGSAIKIYAPEAESVLLNDEEVEFTREGDYIYAVASLIRESVTGAKLRVYPDKDGFVASSTGNEGPANPTFIQASRGWQNRNAYMAFDLSEFEGKEITSATLNMKMVENASAGNVHFYYLDYGTWTRDNLPFVLDSSKMPSHTSTSGGFTGYAYRWSGSGAGTADGQWFSLNTNLKEYLAANNNYKFTWAMLSESGSTRVSGLGGDEEDRPYLEITYNYTVEGEDATPVVTVNKYLDGEKTFEESINGKLGEFYIYNADEVIQKDGRRYYLDEKNSDISIVVEEGENVINVYYSGSIKVNVSTKDVFGGVLKNAEEIEVSPFKEKFVYAPLDILITENAVWAVDFDKSTLVCDVEEGAQIEALYRKLYDVTGENLITNGSFEDEDGNFSSSGWLSPKTNAEIGNPYTTNNFYAVNESEAISNGASASFETTIPDGNWALGTRWNDGVTGLCSIKRHVGVESGKTYLVSYKVKHTSGADGGYLKTSLVAENGAEENNSAEGVGYIGTEWTTVTRVFTATEDTDYVQFLFRWLGDGNNSGNGPYWLFDDFSVREVTPNRIFDYTVTENEGKLLCNVTVDSPDVKKFTAVIAQYDDADCLVSAHYEDKKVEETRDFEIGCDKVGKTYKVFFMESLQNLKPIH